MVIINRQTTTKTRRNVYVTKVAFATVSSVYNQKIIVSSLCDSLLCRIALFYLQIHIVYTHNSFFVPKNKMHNISHNVRTLAQCN